MVSKSRHLTKKKRRGRGYAGGCGCGGSCPGGCGPGCGCTECRLKYGYASMQGYAGGTLANASQAVRGCGYAGLPTGGPGWGPQSPDFAPEFGPNYGPGGACAACPPGGMAPPPGTPPSEPPYQTWNVPKAPTSPPGGNQTWTAVPQTPVVPPGGNMIFTAVPQTPTLPPPGQASGSFVAVPQIPTFPPAPTGPYFTGIPAGCETYDVDAGSCVQCQGGYTLANGQCMIPVG